MALLIVNEERHDKSLTLEFSGRVDESSALPSLTQCESLVELVLDLKNLTSMNSMGIKAWVLWIKQVPKHLRIIYRRCPAFLVSQMKVFLGFLPPGARIESFYVPYFCPACKAITAIPYDNTPQTALEDSITCPKCQQAAEIDIIKSDFLP